jgi:prepilin-type N-terminal cleavage/methylation domain-containing protein
MRQPAKGNRLGFTLVELMVVITIIVVLVAILVPTVIRALAKGPETVARVEIAQFETALEAFKTRFGVDYVPSRIRLCKLLGSYSTSTSQLDKDSVAYIHRLFPRLDLTSTGKWSTTGINWNPNSTTGNDVLEGHQCLVFFLGGIPALGTPKGVTGFGSDPTDPSSATNDRIGPFYDFSDPRLTLVSTAVYYSYNDPWGTPYAFYGKEKPYANSFNLYLSDTTVKTDDNISLATLGLGGPYQQNSSAPIRYFKGDSFQIISAGADKQFGPGGFYDPTNPGSVVTAGKDDLANFSGSKLGNAQ